MSSYQIIRSDAASLEDLVRIYDPDSGAIRLDLGCGYYKKSGFIGLDNFDGAMSQVKTESGPDVRIDLVKERIPFPDDSVTEIFTSHFLEHVPIDVLLVDIYRVLKPRGAVQIVLPYANSAQGLYPGHLAFYTERFFLENVHFGSLFSIYKIGWRKTEAFRSLPAHLGLDFGLARQVLFNVCDEFTLFCVPRKDPNIRYDEIAIEEYTYIKDY
ncbi:MAG: methyltransferase domain-containing protein [Rhizobiales bacterium]|nr:methyltransferase domain-containing protein [Hyphomicrobiales bacterium]